MEKRPSTEAPIQRKTPSSSNNIDFDKHYEEEKKRNNQLLSTEDYIFVSSFEIFSSLFHPAQVWKTSARSISVSYFIAHLFVVLFVLVLFSWPYKNDALSFCAAWLVLSLYTSTRIISCFFFVLFCFVVHSKSFSLNIFSFASCYVCCCFFIHRCLNYQIHVIYGHALSCLVIHSCTPTRIRAYTCNTQSHSLTLIPSEGI